MTTLNPPDQEDVAKALKETRNRHPPFWRVRDVCWEKEVVAGRAVDADGVYIVAA